MNPRQEPFPDHVDTSLFYDGGSRRDIVEQIKAALSEDVVLMTLTGTDGSGKTMLCRIIQEDLSGDREVVYFDRGVDSFDDVVNRIAAQVGLEEPEEISDRRVRLEKAVELLSDSDRRLIIIIDSAENIFLATLERIRRMLDEVNGERLCIQLILSGRPLLSLHYKQLAIIAFETVEERHFSLDPLDADQTFEYLNHCLDQAGFPEQERFSRAQAENIADVARGNFRVITQLGGRYFDPDREVDLDESEIEELYNGFSAIHEYGAYEKISAGLRNVDLDFLKVPRLGTRWYLLGGGLIVLIIIFLLFRGDEQEPEELPGSADVPELTLEKVEPDPIEIPEPAIPPAPVTESVSGQAPESRGEEVSTPDPEAAVQTAAAEGGAHDDAPPPAEQSALAAEARSGLTFQEAEPAAEPEKGSGQSEPVVLEPAAVVETEPVAAESAAAAETEPVAAESAAAAETGPVAAEPAAVAETEPVAAESAAVAETEPVAAESAAVAETEPVAAEPAAVAETKPVAIEPAAVAETEPVAAEAATVAETEPAAPEPAAVVEADPVAAKQLTVENETEPAAKQAESVTEVSDKREQNIVNVSPDADTVAVKSVALHPREKKATIDQTPPRPVPEEDASAAEKRGTQSLAIPQLTMIPRKLPATESVPSGVVTLNKDSKIKPERAPAPAVSQAVEEEPEPESEPITAQRVSDSTRQRDAEFALPDSQPAEKAPVRVARTETSAQPVQRGSAPLRNPDTYYAERLAAGSRWLVGGSSRKYTVQLMVLDADDARENVREMLFEDGYQSILDKLYILRNSAQPQTVMLYYGEFDSSAEARRAKAQLPPFLNRLAPYELAVREAVAKARAGQ